MQGQFLGLTIVFVCFMSKLQFPPKLKNNLDQSQRDEESGLTAQVGANKK